MQDIKNLSLEELESLLVLWGKPCFSARQIFSWIYNKASSDFNEMSNLSQGLRACLGKEFFIYGMVLLARRKSRDGAEKLLFGLRDGNSFEAVIIPAKNRTTACLSTQVGCRFKCKFCASGELGFKRNLTCGEIIEEALLLKRYSPGNRITNIVFMGTGEPFDNYDNVLKAIRIINSSEGLNIGARRITISTCGIINGIKRLASESLQVELSVSLHAANDSLRSRIMPVNKKYPLEELVDTCRQYINKTGRQVTFEYVLINGLNSDLQNAQNLGKILKGLKLAKLNLIPANRIKELNITAPSQKDIFSFIDYLKKQEIVVTLRKSRGEDIEAACGQLKLKYDEK